MSDQTEYRPRLLRVKNTEAEEIPAYSVAEIESWDANFVAQLGKPTADNLPAAQLVITGPSAIPAGGTAVVSIPEAGKVWCTYGTGTPSIGDEIGTLTDDWTLNTGKTGFKVAGTAGGRACVSPFNSGDTLTLAYIQSMSISANESGSFGAGWHYRYSAYTNILDADSNPVTLTVPGKGFLVASQPSFNSAFVYAVSGSTERCRGIDIKIQYADAASTILFDITQLRIEADSGHAVNTLSTNGIGINSADKYMVVNTSAGEQAITQARLGIGLKCSATASNVQFSGSISGGITVTGLNAVGAGSLINYP